MGVYENTVEIEALTDEDNILPFRPRARTEPQYPSADPSLDSHDSKRYPVDIRGNVTFGRLMSGLSTVGLTVRVDARSGHVIIADELND
jgi:hypothetical protein